MNSLPAIRPTVEADIPAVLSIYDSARGYMRSVGNSSQWSDDYPGLESLKADIAACGSYVIEAHDRVVGTFFFTTDPEPSYRTIYQGRWLDDGPYGVIHRAASDGTVSGIMRLIVDYCIELAPSLRIDTHADNRPMLSALERLGFSRCGIIRLARSGDERVALQKLKENP